MAGSTESPEEPSAVLSGLLVDESIVYGCVGIRRSEEHTSELQSHSDLVCRLLLDPATTQIYTLSLHDALPISTSRPRRRSSPLCARLRKPGQARPCRARCPHGRKHRISRRAERRSQRTPCRREYCVWLRGDSEVGRAHV